MKNIFGFDNINIIDSFKLRKLHSCVLLCGKKGIGKASFIYNNVASIILSQDSYEFEFNPSKIQKTEKLISNNSHPDLLVIDIKTLDEDGKENTSKKNEINVSQVRNIIKKTNYTNSISKYKVIVIDSIDEVNINGQNALLKTLEEPDKNTFIFIVCNNLNNVLDTIKSRCIIYMISDLSFENWRSALIQEDEKILNSFSDIEFHELYEQSNKTIALALKMFKFNIFEFQKRILELFLNKNILNISKFASELEDKENFDMFKNSMNIIFNNLYRLINMSNKKIINEDLYHKLLNNSNTNNILNNYDYYNKIINDINVYNLSKTHCINVLFNRIFA